MSGHGTTHLYNKGCRCDQCKAAKSGANMKHREEVLKPERVSRSAGGAFEFERMLSVLTTIRKNKDISAEEVANILGLSIKTVHKILYDLMSSGFIVSGFVVTKFMDGYYIYSVSEKTDKALEEN